MIGAKTAIPRKKPSVPARTLERLGLIVGSRLDYGCGHGADADFLDADKFDPEYFPNREGLRGEYDTITCTYVLNVLPPRARKKVLRDIFGLLAPGGSAFITVRRDIKEPTVGRGCKQYPVILPAAETLIHVNGSFETYKISKDSA